MNIKVEREEGREERANSNQRSNEMSLSHYVYVVMWSMQRLKENCEKLERYLRRTRRTEEGEEVQKRITDLEGRNVELLLRMDSLKVDLAKEQRRTKVALAKVEDLWRSSSEKSRLTDELQLQNDELRILLECNIEAIQKMEQEREG